MFGQVIKRVGKNRKDNKGNGLGKQAAHLRPFFSRTLPLPRPFGGLCHTL